MSSFAPQCGVNYDTIRIVSYLTPYFGVKSDSVAGRGGSGGAQGSVRLLYRCR
jgi:hypothetical protein